MRSLYLWDAGAETPEAGFVRDHALMAVLGAGGPDAAVDKAYARLWRWPVAGLGFGRYHRMPDNRRDLARRISGGKIIALGPGVLGLTLVLPGAWWLDPGKVVPRPEQILNRALRPLLSLLRECGAAAFYPGRDLVTVDGAVVAHASFTQMPDGALLVEQHLSVTESFSEVPSRLSRLDPTGTAATDPSSFAEAVTLDEITAAGSDRDWRALVADHMRASFVCEVSGNDGPPPELEEARQLDRRVFEMFCAERGALPQGWVSAVALQSLGVVETAARIAAGRIEELVISGDVIAPAATLDLIAEKCVGHPPVAATARRAVIDVLARPGHFLFGVENLDDLIDRMA